MAEPILITFVQIVLGDNKDVFVWSCFTQIYMYELTYLSLVLNVANTQNAFARLLLAL